MRQLYALIRNQFLREFSSPISLIFFIVLPVLFTAAVGVGLNGMMASDTDSPPQELRVPLYVVAADNGPLVEALIETLSEVNLLPERVATLPADAFGLEIPADFSAHLQAGEPATLTLHLLPDDNASFAVEQAVRAAQGRVGGTILVAQAGVEQARQAGIVASPEEERAFFTDILSTTLEDVRTPPAVAQVRWPEGVAINTTQDMATNVEQASAGQLVTWVQITLLGAAEVLVDERLRGTLRRMLALPTSRTTILMGKLLSTFLMGLLQMALLLLSGVFLFNVNWGRDAEAVALVSATFALSVVSLGILLSTFLKSRGQANSIVIGLSLAMAALGGAWYPMEITPPLYRQIVQLFPSTWAMRAYTDLLVRNARVPDVLPYVGVLLGFSIVFLGIGIARFRRYE